MWTGFGLGSRVMQVKADSIMEVSFNIDRGIKKQFDKASRENLPSIKHNLLSMYCSYRSC